MTGAIDVCVPVISMRTSDDNPPDSIAKVILIILGILVWLWISWTIYQTFVEKPPERQIKRQNELIFVEQCFLKAVANPVYFKPQVLGMMTDNELSYEQAELLNRIAECESGWQNICNSKGCKYGQGIWQIIPSSIKYCEEKLGKKIDPFDIEDNKKCAIYLLTKTPQGVNHWGYPDSWWGSWECWNRFVPLL